MIYNKSHAGMLGTSIRLSLVNTATCYLCIGTVPDDASIQGMLASSTLISSASIGTVSFAGAAYALSDATAALPAWVMTTMPTTKTVTSSKAGTIGWAAISGTDGTNPYLYIVSVSLANQGGVIQLDKTTVAVNDVVTLLGFSYSVWR